MRRLVRFIAFAAFLLGCVVIGGYILHLDVLVTAMPGLPGMSPLTALALVAVAVGLLGEAAGTPWLARAASAVGLAIGAGMLGIRAISGTDILSPAMASGMFGFDAVHAGRMSGATATALACLGMAALVRERPRLADGLSAIALFVAGLALLGFAFGVEDLYALPLFRTMAVHTAVALFALALASMMVRPDRGWAGIVAGCESGVTQRQLAYTLVPPVAAWLLLRLTDAHRIGPAAAMAILVAVICAPLAYLVLRDGRAQAALDRERRANAALAAKAADDLKRRLDEQALTLDREAAERMRIEAAALRSQRMEVVGQLTGGIAHDFNNLLMAIGGNLYLIGKRLPADHTARRYVDNAIAATDRGAKLTGQLLAFSRTQRLDIRQVELDPVLESARETIARGVGPMVRLDMQLAASGGWAMTDPGQLELALLNIAVNAQDAMPEGGRLLVESGPAQARINDRDENVLVIRVSDTGRGMTAEVAARAVEPFFTTKERGKGTGLGLAQAYGFARQCGGDLRISSVVGVGTTVEILLPETAPARSDTGLMEQKGDDFAEVAEIGRRLVLVIDDDDGVRTVMADALRGVGFEVAEARNGLDGLAQLETLEPVAAIIDFIMPGMNGAEVARRAQLRRPGLPIVFVSGYFDTIALDGIAGAVVLRKPFDVEGLQRSVTSVLQ